MVMSFGTFIILRQNPFRTKSTGVIGLALTLKVVPEKFFKHLKGSDGLYEMRVKVGSNIYRIFCFFNKGNLIILLNGFQKKSTKTPKNEIRKAEQLKQQYYEDQK